MIYLEQSVRNRETAFQVYNQFIGLRIKGVEKFQRLKLNAGYPSETSAIER